MHASAAPGAVEAVKSVDSILDTGIVGAVCVLLIVTLVFLARALMKSHKERIQDLTTYTNKIKEGNEAMYDLVVETSKASAHNSSETLLSNREVLSKVSALESKLQQVDSSLGLLKEQQVRLEVAFARGSK